ncbi:MAG: hypothetical protein ABSG64_00720 [Solirubrobacteraceae bacterium]|jgi:hypothetical protein
MLACIYHWYMAGLYASPVILVGGFVWISSLRERRRGEDGPPDQPGALA